MATISRSSKRVTLVIGNLNTVPKHAHWILLFLSKACNTPKLLTAIKIKVKIFTAKGAILSRYAKPKNNSRKG